MPGYEMVGKEEIEAVNRVVASKVFFRHGFDNIRNEYAVESFEKSFADYMGKKYALAVSSGTAALRVALAAFNYEAGSEIITTCFTFVATIEAVKEANCKPVAVGVDETLTICPQSLEQAITNKTKAVIVVHMLGSPCNMDAIRTICETYNLDLIEDTAWGLGGDYKGEKLGALSDIGTFSFDHAKALTTGEGGMLLTDNEELYFKAKAWHDHGHENNSKVPRWEDTRASGGFNFRMTEMQGAIGNVQLRKLNKLIYSQRKFNETVTSFTRNSDRFRMKAENHDGYPSFDAVLIRCETPKLAIETRNALVNQGFGSKILPEAITWHFAGSFTHIIELECKFDVEMMRKQLSEFIALPSFYNPPNGYMSCLEKVLNG